jgi:hypothetical protein
MEYHSALPPGGDTITVEPCEIKVEPADFYILVVRRLIPCGVYVNIFLQSKT